MKSTPTENTDSIFLPLIKGEKPEFVIAENEQFMAVIEENPLMIGHCLVFTKRIEDSFFDLSDDETANIMIFAKSVSQAIKKTVDCKKIGLAVIGLQVRHAHIHLVPINCADDLNFTRTRLALTPKDLSDSVNRIKAHLK